VRRFLKQSGGVEGESGENQLNIRLGRQSRKKRVIRGLSHEGVEIMG